MIGTIPGLRYDENGIFEFAFAIARCPGGLDRKYVFLCARNLGSNLERSCFFSAFFFFYIFFVGWEVLPFYFYAQTLSTNAVDSKPCMTAVDIYMSSAETQEMGYRVYMG